MLQKRILQIKMGEIAVKLLQIHTYISNKTDKDILCVLGLDVVGILRPSLKFFIYLFFRIPTVKCC